jgi:hypothetical protein
MVFVGSCQRDDNPKPYPHNKPSIIDSIYFFKIIDSSAVIINEDTIIIYSDEGFYCG